MDTPKTIPSGFGRFSVALISLMYILLALFTILISAIVIKFLNPIFIIRYISLFIAYPFIKNVTILLISILGIAIIVIAIKTKPDTTIKKFLYLSGFSVIGTSIVFGCLFSQFLNNLSYRILLFLFGSIFLDKISGGLESFLFFLALFIYPEAFLVGIIGSIVLFIKRRKTVQK